MTTKIDENVLRMSPLRFHENLQRHHAAEAESLAHHILSEVSKTHSNALPPARRAAIIAHPLYSQYEQHRAEEHHHTTRAQEERLEDRRAQQKASMASSNKSGLAYMHTENTEQFDKDSFSDLLEFASKKLDEKLVRLSEELGAEVLNKKQDQE